MENTVEARPWSVKNCNEPMRSGSHISRDVMCSSSSRLNSSHVAVGTSPFGFQHVRTIYNYDKYLCWTIYNYDKYLCWTNICVDHKVWLMLIVEEANCGNCDTARESAGCDNALIQDCVCNLADPLCCTHAWDPICVAIAKDTCDFECTDRKLKYVVAVVVGIACVDFCTMCCFPLDMAIVLHKTSLSFFMPTWLWIF